MALKALFATSNGTGLGHLNRAMAIARRLPSGSEPVLFTLSQAVPAVVGAGFRVEYHPGYRRPASGSDWQWNMRLRRRLEDLLADEEPDVVVFDGVHPYRALTHVLSAPGAPPSIWCRRPLWRRGSPAAPLRRTGAFDAVLEPGELAGDRDLGPTVARREETVRVAPIVFCDPRDLLPRERAAHELGLDPERRTALVNLGQGGATDDAVRVALDRLGAERDLQVAVLRSSIGSGIEAPRGTRVLQATFPMSRYFRAFDLAVAAAGYNAFHEHVAFALPTLFVPMPRQTDDQGARASWAAETGAALAVAGPTDPALPERVGELLEPASAEGLARRCGELSPGNGATAAAELVEALARGQGSAPAVRDRNPLRRWLRLSSNRVGPSLPLALGLTARDLLRHPDRRRPDAVVLATGLAGAELAGALGAEIARAGLDPGRLLVLTDSLDFPLLRELGVGIERLPAPAELGLDDDSPELRRLREERLERLLSRWRPRPEVRRLEGAERGKRAV